VYYTENMNDNYLVSVVIPAYNAEEYIRDCLVATLNQTYTNIEVIIVDDNSIDSTVSICKEYADRDNRIRIINNNGNGVSAARNTGIQNASGKYIVFFDTDDCPDAVLIQYYLDAVKLWRGKNVSLILCGMYYDNVLNKYVEDKISILEPYYGYIIGEKYLLSRNYAATLAWLGIFNFVTNKIYDVEKLKKYNIQFDELISIGEDLKFNLDYLEKSNGYFGMINTPLYHYIKRSDSSLSFTYHITDIEVCPMLTIQLRTHLILFENLLGVIHIFRYSFGQDIISNILCYIMYSSKSQMISFSEYDLLAGQAVLGNTSPKGDRLQYK